MSTRLEKLQKKIREEYPDFEAAVAGLSTQELDAALLRYAKESVNVMEAKDNDSQLEQTKNLLKELNAPYKDALKAIKLKSQFILALIGEKGGDDGKVSG